MKRMIIFCLVALVSLVGSSAYALSYDAYSQFDLTNNPASVGNWEYGYTQTLGGTFGLLPTKLTTTIGTPPIEIPIGWGLPSRYPDVFLGSGDLTLHPGYGGEYAIVRWVTPEAGQYSIAATFTGNYDQTNARIDFLHENASQFNSIIAGNSSIFYGALLALSAGDTIDFAVNRGPDNNADWDRVRLNATISPVSPVNSVPEPATMLLLGLGLIGLVGVKRKIKK